ncbi:MAG TPA: YdeI/OmpD-associated family protein [Gemmatimonadaceae bacterium]|nr:YdeI/OmpD-associated family protein [Gemmatimonadaceae bacterium]
MAATYFVSPTEFRAWLELHHDSATELLVGFYKRASGRAGITYSEALDEALSFGWIDGVRRGVDDTRYTIRFSPRKPASIWSGVNIKRVGELTAAGRMREPGLAAFARRDEKRSRIYAYERGHAALDADALAAFARLPKAKKFYDAQAPWYRRTTAHWVTSAKRPETRARRLAQLIDCSKRGVRIDALLPSGSSGRKKRS